jgi:hypothetical protein
LAFDDAGPQESSHGLGNDGGAHGQAGRPKPPLVLTGEERLTLERLVKRRRSGAGDRFAGPDRAGVRRRWHESGGGG